MRTFEVLSAVIILAVTVSAQYQYQKPPPPPSPKPKDVYLPPPVVTKPPYESDTKIAADSQKPNDGWTEDGGMPFDFTYAVKDDVGNDFSHQAESNGDVVKGEYKTLLPDGRVQVVKYTADWKNGYNAEVTYEGEASYPEPKPTPSTPKPRNPYENEEIIDSQGLTPPPKPRPTTTRAPYVPPPPPPTTTRAPYVPPPPPRTTTRAPYVPPPPPRTTTRAPYVPPPPPTTRPTLPPRTTQPPVEPPGLYGAPSLPFGVRNNPKFGYNSRK